jgi:hypothetical protein
VLGVADVTDLRCSVGGDGQPDSQRQHRYSQSSDSSYHRHGAEPHGRASLRPGHDADVSGSRGRLTVQSRAPGATLPRIREDGMSYAMARLRTGQRAWRVAWGERRDRRP